MTAVLVLNLPVKKKTMTSSTHVMTKQTKRMAGKKVIRVLRKHRPKSVIKRIRNIENQNVIVIVETNRLVGRKSRLIVENHRMIVKIKVLINRIGRKVGIGRPVVEISRSMIGISRPIVVINQVMIGISHPVVKIDRLMIAIGRLIVGIVRPIVNLPEKLIKVSLHVKGISRAKNEVGHRIVGKDRLKVENSHQMMGLRPPGKNRNLVEVGKGRHKVENSRQMMGVSPPGRNISLVEVGKGRHKVENNRHLMKIRSLRKNTSRINVKICCQTARMYHLIIRNHLMEIRTRCLVSEKNHLKLLNNRHQKRINGRRKNISLVRDGKGWQIVEKGRLKVENHLMTVRIRTVSRLANGTSLPEVRRNRLTARNNSHSLIGGNTNRLISHLVIKICRQRVGKCRLGKNGHEVQRNRQASETNREGVEIDLNIAMMKCH
jgi:hypothetical protein